MLLRALNSQKIYVRKVYVVKRNQKVNNTLISAVDWKFKLWAIKYF